MAVLEEKETNAVPYLAWGGGPQELEVFTAQDRSCITHTFKVHCYCGTCEYNQ